MDDSHDHSGHGHINASRGSARQAMSAAVWTCPMHPQSATAGNYVMSGAGFSVIADEQVPRLLMMKKGKMKRPFLAVPVLMAAAACATIGTVTAEERASCQAMAARMGTSSQHSHQEVKGIIAQTPMNRRHDRCRAIARQDAAQAGD